MVFTTETLSSQSSEYFSMKNFLLRVLRASAVNNSVSIWAFPHDTPSAVSLDEIHHHMVPRFGDFAIVKMGDVVKDVRLGFLIIRSDHIEEF